MLGRTPRSRGPGGKLSKTFYDNSQTSAHSWQYGSDDPLTPSWMQTADDIDLPAGAEGGYSILEKGESHRKLVESEEAQGIHTPKK